MFELKKYIQLLSEERYKEADKYRIDNMPKVIYKYIALKSSESYKGYKDFEDSIQDDLNKLEAISSNKIWLSTCSNLNDPFELNALYIDEERLNQYNWPIAEVKEIFEGFKGSFLIGSFTTHLNDCLPMWAHYANNHCGICVEYAVIDPTNLYKVSYEYSRVPIAVIITNIINEYYLEENEGKVCEDTRKYISSLLHSACIKDKSWEYEDEYRILHININKEKNGDLVNLIDIGLKMSAIYLGINCSKEHEEKLRKICNQQNCHIYRMGINNKDKSFSLIHQEIN